MATEDSGEGGEVFIRLMDGTPTPPICEWLKFSTNDDDEQLTLFSKYQDPNVLSSVVIAGSSIYRVGGWDSYYHTSSTAVFRYDTSVEVEPKWEAAPPMNGSKIEPQVLFTGGKIYAVIHPSICLQPRPKTIDCFAEYFDPLSNQGWMPLVCTYEGNAGPLFSFLNADDDYDMSILEPGVTILFTATRAPTFLYHVLDGALIKLDGGHLPYKIKRLAGFLAHNSCGKFVPIGDFLFSINFYNGSVYCYNPKNDVMLVQPNVLGDDYADKVVDGKHAVLAGSGDCLLGLLHVVWLSFESDNRHTQWKLKYTAIAVPTDINYAGSIGHLGYGLFYGCRVMSSKSFLLPAFPARKYNSLDGLFLVKAGSLLNSQLDMDISYERVEVREVLDEVQQNSKYLHKDIPSLDQEAILSPALSDPSGRNTMTWRDSGTWKRRKHF